MVSLRRRGASISADIRPLLKENAKDKLKLKIY